VSKLTDCDGENGETDSSIDFALQCRYISDNEHKSLTEKSASVGRRLGSMIRNPDPFLLTPDP
jgi:four helix bundle protein